MIPKRVWDTITTTGEYVLDLETTGLDPHKDTITGMAVLVGGQAHFADFRPGGDATWTAVSQDALAVFADPNITMIGHNLKFDVKFLKVNGCNVQNMFADTMVMSFLVDERRKHALKSLAKELLGIGDVKEWKDVLGNGKMPTAEEFAAYGVQDVTLTRALYEMFLPILEAEGLMNVFTKLEMPFIRVLIDMELNGIAVSKRVLKDREKELAETAAKIEQEIYALAGEQFNINSPKQLAKLLYGKLGIVPGADVAQLKDGSFSTDKAALVDMKLRGIEIATKILLFRKMTKEMGTYATTLIERLSDTTEDVGVIYANFHHTGARTGRLSSSEPNLQNIPRGPAIRSAFVSRFPGGKILALDYSQVELRIVAHYSQDPAMMKVYTEGGDIHAETAKACGCRRDPIAKNVNFGIVYGLGAKGLRHNLKTNDEVEMDQRTAEKIRTRWLKKYSAVPNRYHVNQRNTAVSRGYVKTITGRRRRLDHFTLDDFRGGPGFSTAVNTTIQGSAADIIKIAMRNIWREQQTDPMLAQVLMVAQVHDELLFDVPPGLDEQAIQKKISDMMVSAVTLRVPIEVDSAYGDSWATAK